MTKILLLLTGGTIGSESRDGVLQVSDSAVSELEQRWRETHPSADVQFMTEHPYSLLSENARPMHWELLTRAVQRQAEGIDGVIIAHGSDTLAFSAAALSFSLAGIGIPVVLTGADRPLCDPLSNGLRNFSAAVSFVKNERIPGVFAVFENPDGEMLIHLGSRIRSAQAMKHRFDSLFDCPFGWFEQGWFVYNSAPNNVSVQALKQAAGKLRFAKASFCPDVLMLEPYPGLDYSRIQTGGLRAVLHGTYHSSTACVEGEETSLLRFAKKCREQRIPVLLGPTDRREEHYESAALLIEAGVRLLGPMTREAALAKLMLGVSVCRTQQALAEWMQEHLCFELIK
ncbi:MAG: hypothetical protein HFE85_02060 [Clostridiales bacterium]|nr:hypothetical protein [Clostridiales bacterium]